MKRKPVSAKLRFSVLERDQFTCQYCGARQPYVTLHVDHRDSVANGGENDFDNLITACQPCNLGKGARSVRPISAVGIAPDPAPAAVSPPMSEAKKHALVGLCFLSYLDGDLHWQGEFTELVKDESGAVVGIAAQLYGWVLGHATDIIILRVDDVAAPRGSRHWFRLFPDHETRNAEAARS